MRFENGLFAGPTTGLVTTSRRRLVAGGAMALLFAGSLAFSTPAFAQDDAGTGEVTEETAAGTGETEGTTVQVGNVAEEVPTDAAAAPADAAAAPADAAAAPAADTAAAPATGAAAPTALPSTGVGDVAGASLPLIALAAAGAVAASAIAVNQARPSGRRA